MSSGRAARMAKVTIDTLDDEIQKVLNDFEEKEVATLNDAIKESAALGAKALKSSSRQTFGGRGYYAKGWTYKVEGSRMTPSATIYNAKTPGLPHLLEYGHAKRGGGRVVGREHIAPVEEQVIKSLQRELEHRL